MRAWLDVRLTERKEWTKGYSALAATSLTKAMVNESSALGRNIGPKLECFLSTVTVPNAEIPGKLHLNDGGMGSGHLVIRVSKVYLRRFYETVQIYGGQPSCVCQDPSS